ncbi:MAG: tetratricopeptide repeat protein [Anaerolineales bacterium]|nr:tetratricopeptide repeat protein [Anaerolineales bacterium]
MRKKRRPTNWFVVASLIVLILLVSYLDRFVIPNVPPPFLPTATPTRNPDSYLAEAQALAGEGKFLQAINVYQEAILLKPNEPTLYLELARAQIYAGQYEAAITNASNALLLNPNNALAHAIRGWALTRQEKYDEANQAIQEALRLDPGNGVIHAHYAILLGKMYEKNTGPYTDPLKLAIEESKTALSLASGTMEAHWARGYILYLTGNRELAVEQYRKAIEIQPNIAQLHLELGVVYRSLEMIDEALQEYNLANTLNPSDYLPDLYSSRALAVIGKFSQAVQYAETAMRDNPTDPYVRGNYAYMLYKSYEWSAALEQFRLVVHGGQTEEGQTIEPLPIRNDEWIARYYYAYVILLAETGQCADVLTLTQVIRGALPGNEFAIYNTDYALSKCAQIPTPAATQAAATSTSAP